MKSHIIACAIGILLSGCASENEQKGLDHISNLYDATTSYSKSFSSEVGSETVKKFNVKVTDSKRIDTLQPTVTTANIALLMYQSLTEKERSGYTHIEVELINSRNDTAAYYYPMDIIEVLDVKSDTYTSFSQSLVDGNYARIDELRNTNEIPKPVARNVKTKIDAMENSSGKLVGYESFGIAEATDEKGTIYQYQGYMVFENGARKPYFIVVDAAKKKNELIGFKIF